MDAFEQKELDLALVEGGLAHGSPGDGPEKTEGDASMVQCSKQPLPAMPLKRVSPSGEPLKRVRQM
jgi:hypothetical protein